MRKLANKPQQKPALTRFGRYLILPPHTMAEPTDRRSNRNLQVRPSNKTPVICTFHRWTGLHQGLPAAECRNNPADQRSSAAARMRAVGFENNLQRVTRPLGGSHSTKPTAHRAGETSSSHKPRATFCLLASNRSRKRIESFAPLGLVLSGSLFFRLDAVSARSYQQNEAAGQLVRQPRWFHINFDRSHTLSSCEFVIHCAALRSGRLRFFGLGGIVGWCIWSGWRLLVVATANRRNKECRPEHQRASQGHESLQHGNYLLESGARAGPRGRSLLLPSASCYTAQPACHQSRGTPRATPAGRQAASRGTKFDRANQSLTGIKQWNPAKKRGVSELRLENTVIFGPKCLTAYCYHHTLVCPNQILNPHCIRNFYFASRLPSPHAS
jgi:hypothetical protein